MRHHMITCLMLSAIVQRNPGSATDTYIVPSLDGGPGFLLRAFFYLGACVRTFMYCLPVLCIDGTFLTGRYKGTILTAIRVDCNKQVVPIAFAFLRIRTQRAGTGSLNV